MLSDAEFSHRLNVALAPVSKIFQNPLPSRRSFVAPSTSSAVSNPHISSSPRPRYDSLHGNNEASNKMGANVDGDALRSIAHAECESRVEGLGQWIERAQQGRRMGEQCLGVLRSLSRCLTSMRDVTDAVQEQSNHLSSNASALMVRKTKLELVQEELQRMIRHYTHIEDLAREAEHPTLCATSTRYPGMLQEMEEEMQFLARNPQFLSSKTYATKLAVAQQKAYHELRDAVVTSLQLAQNATAESDAYRGAFISRQQQQQQQQQVRRAGNSNGHPNPSTITEVAEVEEEAAEEAPQLASDALGRVNRVFLEKLEEKASLRRMIEARGGGGSGGDVASLAMAESDANDADVLEAYREVRVAIVGPLLQDWLEAWCGGDATARPLPQLVGHVAALMRVAIASEKGLFDDVWLRDDFSARAFAPLVAGLSNEVYHVFRSRLLQVDDLEELAHSIEEIQRANTRQNALAELSGLLTKMVQDAQERLIFRTSVFLRQSIVRCSPTKAMSLQFLDRTKLDKSNPLDHAVRETSMSNSGMSSHSNDDNCYIEALTNCVSLLQLLYPSLEFSVFSVFAEEAIHCTLTQVQELARLMAQQRGEYVALKAFLCQLGHLLHLREELSGIDENITVVEKRIDLTKIAQRRIEIVQSSRESKKDVEGEIKSCCERIVQLLIAEISAPLSGVARKGLAEIDTAVHEVEKQWRIREELLSLYITNPSTCEVLMRPVKARMDELLRETAALRQQQQHPASPQPKPPREVSPPFVGGNEPPKVLGTATHLPHAELNQVKTPSSTEGITNTQNGKDDSSLV